MLSISPKQSESNVPFEVLKPGLEPGTAEFAIRRIETLLGRPGVALRRSELGQNRHSLTQAVVGA